MQSIETLVEDHEYRFAILNIDIVGSSSLQENDSDLNVKLTKQNLFDYFGAIAARHPCIKHSSGDGFLFLFNLVDLSKDPDIAVATGICMFRNLPIFNEDAISGNLLSLPLQIRLTMHQGVLIYAKDPGKISGMALDLHLKNERSMGRAGTFTITDEVFRSVSQSSKRHFRLREGELGDSISELKRLFDYVQVTPASLEQSLVVGFSHELRRLQDVISSSMKAFSAGTATLLERMQQGTSSTEESSTNMAEVLKEVSEKVYDELEDFWESDAKNAIAETLKSTEWDEENREVHVYDGEYNKYSTFADLESLRSYLEDVSDSAYYASVPFDGGEPVWQSSSEDWVLEALEEYSEQIARNGWEL